MYAHALRYEEFNGTVYYNVRLCPRDHSYILSYQDLKGSISTVVRPRKPCNIQNDVILAKYMQEPRFCAYSHVLAYGQEHSTGIYLYCLTYT